MTTQEFEAQLQGQVVELVRTHLGTLQQQIIQIQAQVQNAFNQFLEQSEAQLESLNQDHTLAELVREAVAQVYAAGVASVPPPPPPAPPAPLQSSSDLAIVKASILDIQSHQTQADVLTALVNHTANFAPRVALFIVKAGNVVGWTGRGFEGTVDNNSIRGLSVSLQADTLLRTVLSKQSTFAGYPADQADNLLLIKRLGELSPERISGIPLLVRGKAAAVLYVDSGVQAGDAINLETLEILVNIAGMTVEMLSLRGRSAVSGAAAPAPAPPEAVHPAPAPKIEPPPAPEPPPMRAPEPEPPVEEAAPEPAAPPPVEPEPEPTPEPEPVPAPPAAPSWAEPVPAPPAAPSWAEPVPAPPAAPSWAEPVPAPPAAPSWAEPVPAPPAAPSWAEPVPAPPAAPSWAEPPASAPSWAEPAPPPPAFTPPAPVAFQPPAFTPPQPPAFTPSAPVAYEAPAFPPQPAPASFQPTNFAPPPPPVAVEPPSFAPPPPPPPPPPPVQSTPVAGRTGRLSAPMPDVSEEEQKLHSDARRFARLLVSEIKLYNESKVIEGRKNNDLYDRLKEDIDRSRQMYDKRVNPVVATRFDYFHDELVNILGGGDPEKLGRDCPGPQLGG